MMMSALILFLGWIFSVVSGVMMSLRVVNAQDWTFSLCSVVSQTTTFHRYATTMTFEGLPYKLLPYTIHVQYQWHGHTRNSPGQKPDRLALMLSSP